MNDLSNTPTNDRAVIGGNQGPAFNPEVVEEFAAKVSDFADAAAAWKEKGEIKDQETAEKANDFLTGARQLFKAIEDRRKAEKQPFLDAGRDVDTAFNSLKDKIEKAVKLVKAPLESFMREEERKAAEKRRAEAEAARKAEEEAEKKRLAALQRNDVIAEDEAEKAAEEARKAQEQAAKATTSKVGSATGGGRRTAMRTERRAEITNINQAMLHYRSRPELAETLTRLANADVRASLGAEITIPGFKITETRKL